MPTFNFSQFETYKAFLNYWPTATNPNGYYSSDSNNWGFVEAVSKLKYFFSAAQEQYLIEKYYKQIGVEKWQENNPFESTAYDSYFLHNSKRFLLEFKRLHNTSTEDNYLYFPDKNDLSKQDFLPPATVILHCDKVAKLYEAKTDIESRHNKTIESIIYLCYLEKEQAFIYRSVEKIMTDSLRGWAYQNARTIDNRKQVLKASYYPLIKDFKRIDNITNNLTIQDIIETNDLQFLYEKEAEWLLLHILHSCKLNTESFYLQSSFQEIKHYNQCKSFSDSQIIAFFRNKTNKK